MIKRRLLIATDNFPPRKDGISRLLTEIIPSLKTDFKITILAPNFGLKKEMLGEEFKGIRVVLFPISKKEYGDYFPAKPDFKKVLREVKKANVVWTNGLGNISTQSLIAAWWYRKARISFVHAVEYELVSLALQAKGIVNWIIKFGVELKVRLIYNLSSIIVVPSFEVANLLERLGVSKDKFVLKAGVDVKKFRPAKNKAAAKKRLGINPNKIVFGYCGRIAFEKDPLTMLRAFLRLKDENTELIVVGSGVESLEEKFKHRKHVKWFGSRENVVPYLQAMDFFILPSLTETSSLATMEAMSCGVVPIVTPVGLVKDYVKNEYNGFVFEKRNVHSLVNTAKRAVEIYTKDKKRYLKMANNARLMIIKNYQLDYTINQIKQLLKTI